MGQPKILTTRPKTTPLGGELAARLRRDISERGVDVIAFEAGLSPNTITNLAAGRGCHESSKLLARIYLNGREDRP
jgi:hypothetical protein